MKKHEKRGVAAAVVLAGTLALAACQGAADNAASGDTASAAPSADAPEGVQTDPAKFLAQPLVDTIYTADPSAHVFNGKIYVYPSHDIDAGIPDDDLGSQYAMRDYHVLAMDRIGGKVTVGPVALDMKDVPWVSKSMWAPDAAYKNGTYYLYFPAKDKDGVFRMGVATSKDPMGPFKAEPAPIKGSFSIDPAVFTDDDGQSYMYFGGIWGGQLQNWASGQYDAAAGNTDLKQDDKPALSPKVARMGSDMKRFAEKPRDAVILDEAGKPVLGGDHDKRFFEAAWMYKRDGKYYFLYSTGDTHFVNYAIGSSPYGPFTYKGHVLRPVQGWTTHMSMVDWDGKTWLFFHDTQRSGKNHLRNVKVTQVHFNPDGTIQTIDPFVH
ncbi:glycoside hydrolase family 43 protein [Novosphingobium sp. 1949]|uniref:Glycoside hydrolase family 43 protein n=1 Tax=Novosphingobium organovorum TaxID=2930092 RepID=A0ABT0BF89_9SPHN|nr:glycoside hydrolase family 43 protein [Novosphingobium organovorum]MCJ2183710.1 glycoside hydrolase family 43 protein [Novosphingobium organovorum]